MGRKFAKKVSHKKEEMQGASAEYADIFKKFNTEQHQTGEEVLTTQQGLVDKALSELTAIRSTTDNT